MSFGRADQLASWESRFRPLLTSLPPAVAVRLYSSGRRFFLGRFGAEQPRGIAAPPDELAVEMWGLRFRSPLGNAAGMFKNGDGYGVVARQGAGAYLAGTTTGRPRLGNHRRGIATPFVPYPTSHAASNWLGLPNEGHRAVAQRLHLLERIGGCPLGVSVAADPDPELGVEEKLAALLIGLRLYEEAGVDFIELNESCPNTEAAPGDLGHLEERLRWISERFLRQRQRDVPVVVKFSNDTPLPQVEPLVRCLLELRFDGVNFGNTSVDYAALRPAIASSEMNLFDFFTQAFGGGVSGLPLRERSLALGRAAVTAAANADHEFHVWRTGGVETAADLAASALAGISYNQWYSGYFEAFSRRGHQLYQDLYATLVQGQVGGLAQAS